MFSPSPNQTHWEGGLKNAVCVSTVHASRWKKQQNKTQHQFVFCYNPHSSIALLNCVQPALSRACTITVSHLYFSPKISPNLFEASPYLSWLSGRLVCSAHTQLCTPALKATSLQMPVLAGDYLSNALWLARAPGQNHSAEMKLDRLLELFHFLHIPLPSNSAVPEREALV